MAEHIVTVTVSGPVGCGKSAIAGEIEIALKAIGVDVAWENSESEKNMTHADWHSDLDMYRPKVIIKEVIVRGLPDIPPPDTLAWSKP